MSLSHISGHVETKEIERYNVPVINTIYNEWLPFWTEILKAPRFFLEYSLKFIKMSTKFFTKQISRNCVTSE